MNGLNGLKGPQGPHGPHKLLTVREKCRSENLRTASADLTNAATCANLTGMTETYVITRLEGWTDEQWDEIVEAVEDTVVAVARDLGLDD